MLLEIIVGTIILISVFSVMIYGKDIEEINRKQGLKIQEEFIFDVN